jgi:hypothetical protein
MKPCTICEDPNGSWTIEESGFGGSVTMVIRLCEACHRSKKRASAKDDGTLARIMWAINRTRRMWVNKYKEDMERKEREIEALTRLCNRQVKELHELRGDE